MISNCGATQKEFIRGNIELEQIERSIVEAPLLLLKCVKFPQKSPEVRPFKIIKSKLLHRFMTLFPSVFTFTSHAFLLL